MTQNKTKTNWLKKRFESARLHIHTAKRKRGSVLVLVVGVLAVLAVMAISYVSVVRIDRRSTDAYQEQVSLQDEVVVATTYIQSLLTADLFGNRIVNSSTPRLDPNNSLLSNWPKAFEDGEYSDYPWTDVNPASANNTLTGAAYTWDITVPAPSNPNPSPSAAALLNLTNGERAFADDAWLAPIEPIDTDNTPLTNGVAEWDTWSQITNLLSAYRYRKLPNSNQRAWIRDRGRFVDMGQLVLQKALNAPTSGPRQGFPGASLTLNKTQSGLWMDQTSSGQPNGPALGVNQKIFDLRLADLQEEFYWPSGGPAAPLQGDRALQPADERFWADTDGDGRPDARWQQLPVFGNAFGKVWVIATHITDNSAQANVNANIAFMDYANPTQTDRIGDGRTPADIDLFRLIASQVWNAKGVDAAGMQFDSAHPDIRINGSTTFDFNPSAAATDSALERSWQSFLNTGLRIPDILNQLDDLNQDNTNNFTLGETTDFLNDWPGGQLYGDPDDPQNQSNPQNIQPLELKRFERAHIWRYFGADPLHPTTTSGQPFPRTDEIDLRAYGSFNLLNLVSRLEQRLDGPKPTASNQPGFLPGLTPRYEFGPGLGPMRGKEWDNLSSSPRTANSTNFILENNFGNGDYTNQEQLQRIRQDIRHLLTTVSGSGAIGPVPVLNPADQFDRVFSSNKVNLRRFLTPDFTINIDRIRSAAQDTFSAFAWALAPLATNQPLMSPLDQINPTTYAALANNADLHYGGGPTGPANAVAINQYALSPNTAGSGTIGAGYAISRALALTVNTIDALDNKFDIGAGATATTEEPTLIRFFNQPNIDIFLATNPTARTSVLTTRSIAMGTRFPQGDIWGDPQSPPFGAIVSGDPNALALPEEVVGKPENGVTFVGLDRQPFLVRALTVAVYADQGSYNPFDGSAANSVIDPADPAEQLGSLLVVELGNPWPDPIDLAGSRYRVRIANATDSFELDFSDPMTAINGGATISAGSRTAFYYFQGPNGAPASAQGTWDTMRTQLQTEIDAQIGINDVREVTILAPGASTPSAGVMFQNIGAGPAPILLIQSLNGPTGAIGATDVLVDRLSPPPGGDPFPAVLPAAVTNLAQYASQPSFQQNPVYTGRLAVQSVLRRPTDNISSGFPAYVVERPLENIQDFQGFAQNIQVWVAQPNLEPVLPIDDLGQNIIDNVGGSTNGSEIHLIAQNNGSLNLPPFELFVPNGPLYAVSELGQISIFAHMFTHKDQGPPNVADAWDVSTPLMGPGKWATVSEQLGWDAHLAYDTKLPPPATGSTNLNPYLGVLDPSRFILGTGGDLDPTSTAVGTLLPDALAVPLATRIYDAFEALPTINKTGLINGRINVNTAPRRILQLLPFVDPRDPFNATVPTIAGWTTTQVANDTRLDWLERYRRRDQDIPGAVDNPLDNAIPNVGVAPNILGNSYTLLPGLRTTGSAAPWSLGLVNSGELTTMGLWRSPNDGSVDPAHPAFMELGANNADNSAVPLDIRPIATGFEAADDPEERLAIFRAISNIVSTRSDVFTAWYILRAYDPKDIEAITIPQGLTDDQTIDLMNPNSTFAIDPENHKGLVPTFEKRMLVIFDRSSVRLPTDKPKILLQVELPLN